MVGALISVAVGHISIEEIQYMLENPSKHSWNSRINVAPPYGLYLVGVEYDPLEIAMPQEISEQDHKSNTALLGQVE